MSQEILLHSGNSSGDSIEQLMQRYGIPQTRSAYLSMYFAPDEVPDEIPIEVELSIPAKYRIQPRGFVTPTSLPSAKTTPPQPYLKNFKFCYHPNETPQNQPFRIQPSILSR